MTRSESEAITDATPAEIITIKVISGFAKMKKALALRIASDSAAKGRTC